MNIKFNFDINNNKFIIFHKNKKIVKNINITELDSNCNLHGDIKNFKLSKHHELIFCYYYYLYNNGMVKQMIIINEYKNLCNIFNEKLLILGNKINKDLLSNIQKYLYNYKKLKNPSNKIVEWCFNNKLESNKDWIVYRKDHNYDNFKFDFSVINNKYGGWNNNKVINL